MERLQAMEEGGDDILLRKHTIDGHRLMEPLLLARSIGAVYSR